MSHARSFRRHHRRLCLWAGAFLTLCLMAAPQGARADQATIAVAANFTATAKALETAFEAESGHDLVLAFGSTGKLFAQIAHGAPFDAFLAADRARPERAVRDGLAVRGTRFTYARGRIVLFGRDAALIDGPGVLSTPGAFDRLAIANPDTAPYGAAAMQAMQSLGVVDSVQAKLVRGDSIAQAHQFVMTGAAGLGFVAASQVVGIEGGSRWLVPETLHDPIAQDAVLLNRGQANAAATAFLAFLKSPQARAIIEGFGYGVEGAGQ